jgi:hypothetical protein
MSVCWCRSAVDNVGERGQPPTDRNWWWLCFAMTTIISRFELPTRCGSRCRRAKRAKFRSPAGSVAARLPRVRVLGLSCRWRNCRCWYASLRGGQREVEHCPSTKGSRGNFHCRVDPLGRDFGPKCTMKFRLSSVSENNTNAFLCCIAKLRVRELDHQ